MLFKLFFYALILSNTNNRQTSYLYNMCNAKNGRNHIEKKLTEHRILEIENRYLNQLGIMIEAR